MPTALELSREEWQPYLEAARRRLTSAEPTLTEQHQREELLARVRQAADALKDRFQVRRVVLFGSLANTSGWALKSDVDLAVEGLAPNAYWEAWRVVEEIIKDRPVDLIEMENAKSSLLQAIEKYGIEL